MHHWSNGTGRCNKNNDDATMSFLFLIQGRKYKIMHLLDIHFENDGTLFDYIRTNLVRFSKNQFKVLINHLRIDNSGWPP